MMPRRGLLSSRPFGGTGAWGLLIQYGGLLGYLLLVGQSVGMGRWRVLVLLVAPILCAVVYLRPWLGIAVGLGVFYLGERLVSLGYLPKEIGWLPDLIVLSMLSRVLAEARRRPIDLGGPMAWAAIALGILAVTSALVNDMAPISAGVGLRYLFRFLAYYFAVINLGLSRASLRRLVNTLVLIALVQVPVSIAQLWANGSISDRNSGTLHLYGGEEMAFVCMAAAVILLCLYFQGSRRPWALMGTAALMVPGLAAGARGASLVFFPLALLLAVLVNLMHSGRALAGRLKVAAGVLLAVVVLLMYGSSSGAVRALVDANMFYGIDEVIAAESVSGSQYGRLTSLANATSIVKGAPLGVVVGLGPGVTGESEFAFGRARAMVTAEGAFRTQIAASVVELGYLGLILMLAIPLLAFLSLPPLRAYREPYWVALRFAVPVIALMYVVHFSYYGIWLGGASSMLLWLLIAAVRVAGREIGPPLRPRAANRWFTRVPDPMMSW